MKTVIKLTKFLIENNIEWHYHTPDGNVLLIIPDLYYNDFKDIIKEDYGLFDDGGIEIIMKNDYVCVWASHIFDYYDIPLEDVFDLDKKDGYGL